jgi:hypothetical protein
MFDPRIIHVRSRHILACCDRGFNLWKDPQGALGC